jgi:hypothetical protein
MGETKAALFQRTRSSEENNAFGIDPSMEKILS